MKYLLISLLSLGQVAFAANDPVDVKSYQEAKKYLGLVDGVTESRTFYGIVYTNANDESKKSRFTCMALKFVADDANGRLDYMYKGWNTFDPDADCDFMKHTTMSEGQHISCMHGSYPTRNNRYIDMAQLPANKTHLRALNLKDLEKNANAGAEVLGMAQARCQIERRTQPTANNEPVDAAPMSSIQVVNEVVPGSAAKTPQRVMKIRLDLEQIANKGADSFKAVDYVILLDKHPADIKLALADSRFEGTFNVDYVLPTAQGYDYVNSEPNDAMKSDSGSPYAHWDLEDDFMGPMNIDFTGIPDKYGREPLNIHYRFERKPLPGGETDEMTCVGDNKSLPRQIFLGPELTETKDALTAMLADNDIPANLTKAELETDLETFTAAEAKLQGMQAPASPFLKKPVGFIVGQKCLGGQIIDDPEDALQVPLMEIELSEDGMTLKLGALLGPFNQDPDYMGFSHYLLTRTK